MYCCNIFLLGVSPDLLFDCAGKVYSDLSIA